MSSQQLCSISQAWTRLDLWSHGYLSPMNLAISGFQCQYFRFVSIDRPPSSIGWNNSHVGGAGKAQWVKNQKDRNIGRTSREEGTIYRGWRRIERVWGVRVVGMCYFMYKIIKEQIKLVFLNSQRRIILWKLKRLLSKEQKLTKLVRM